MWNVVRCLQTTASQLRRRPELRYLLHGRQIKYPHFLFWKIDPFTERATCQTLPGIGNKSRAPLFFSVRLRVRRFHLDARFSSQSTNYSHASLHSERYLPWVGLSVSLAAVTVRLNDSCYVLRRSVSHRGCRRHVLHPATACCWIATDSYTIIDLDVGVHFNLRPSKDFSLLKIASSLSYFPR